MAKHPDWLRIGQSHGTPVYVDFPVIAKRRREYETRFRLALELFSPEGDRYGMAYVRPDEGYPGCSRVVHFSHYEPLLRRAFDGLRALGRPEQVRLQVLKAVYAGTERRSVTLLKFIIGPEHAIEGSQVETVYSCPLRGFFEGFLCLPADCLERSESFEFVIGRAVHQGYRWAAQAQASNASPHDVAEAYRRGVIAVFVQDFPTFLSKVPRGGSPFRAHTAPLDAQQHVVRRCLEKFGALSHGDRLYHERLFYSPQRGISGKADRLLVSAQCDGDGPGSTGARKLELYELKTHTSGIAERDPRSGRQAVGGIQALTYHEAMRTIEGGRLQRACGAVCAPRIDTRVELYEGSGGPQGDGGFTEIPLAEHPVLTRPEVPLDSQNDRYLDLIAQNRNLGYLAESGLLTGYDRNLLADLIQSGRRLRGIGGLFDLMGSVPPCSFCPGQARGICEDAPHYYRTPPMPAFFRWLPDALFRYWAWFHAQVRHELNATKQHLYRLGETDPDELEREGTTVTGLTLLSCDDRTVRLGRPAAIETRLREGDTVLVSDDASRPGDGFSAEGRITALGPDTLDLELSDAMLPETDRFRVDQFAHVAQTRWQAQGLTDFLVASVAASRVRGRAVRVVDLPWLARVLLGDTEPELPAPIPLPHLHGVLNGPQLRAAGTALALPEEGLMLLQGPPGTGKTQWVAHLVHEIVKARFLEEGTVRPVLVLTNTHRAADEVVRKLDATFPEMRPYVIRIGQPGRDSDDAVARHTLTRMLNVPEVLDQLDFANPAMDGFVRLLKKGELILQHAAVFVGTLGSVTAPELRGLSFAYTIVDEAGQATEPATLQALRHLPPGYRGRLILVGDHKQLPPVVPEDLVAGPVPEELLAAGLRAGETMRISLFERLARRYPGILLTLSDQYRMCGPICRLVSDTFYEGRLQPGNDEVARATLETLYERLGARPQRLSGLAERVFRAEVPVVLLDTSQDPFATESGPDLGSYESRDNAREAEVIAGLLAAYLQAWPADRWPDVCEEIGVISAYRRQNNRIRQALARRVGAEAAAQIRVDTVDRFQGGEKPILFVSMVSHGSLGRLHHEWRRMNVSLSRAMHKLILVGSRGTFCAPGGEGLEAEARACYRALFHTLDELASEGSALVADTRGIAL